MPAADARGPESRWITVAIAAACALVFVLRLAAAATPSNWVWGLAPLRYWPHGAAAALLALALLGFVPPVASGIVAALERCGRLWERAPLVADTLVALTVAALVLSLVDSVQFAGDFALRVGMLDTPLSGATLFPQAFPLDLLVNVGVARALVHAGMSSPLALRTVGALLAGAFAFGVLGFARAAGARGAALPAAAIVLLSGGYVAHFSGYDKYGPLLVGIALAGTGATQLARRGRGAWTLALGTATCVLSHRVGYAILPAAMLAFVMAARGARDAPERRGVVIAGSLTLAIAALQLPFTLHVLTTIDRSVHLPGSALAKSLQGAGSSVALMNAAEAVNLLFFLFPLWLVGLVAIAGGRVRPEPEERERFALGWPAALAALTHFVVLFVVRATRGGGRDWDAYTGTALVVALISTAGLVAVWRRRVGPLALAPVVSSALSMAVAFWGVHASERINLARIHTLIEARPLWSEVARSFAYDHLGVHAINAGRYAEASSAFEQAFALAPNPRYAYQAGLAHLRAGQLEQARGLFAKAAELVPKNPDPWVGLANVALAEGDTASAAMFSEGALRLSPGHAGAREVRRALAALRQGRPH